MRKESGFTLIELIMVIVILGILAATALPKFIDLKSDAQDAATKGVAGAVSSAFAVNFAAHAANSAKGVSIAGAAVTIGTAAGSVMQGGMPSGYTVAGTVDCTSGAGNVNAITVSGPNVSSATATLICTG